MTDTPILRALSAAVGATDAAPDGELLRRFADVGDRSAFELVVRRHAELVWGVCRAALPNRADAEDAFQAAFLILARKARAVREASAAGWLFRVARNVAVRVRKHAARQSAGPLPDALASASASAEDTAILREAAPIVAEEVARLAAKFREPVVLCVFEGHTHAEAAARLGWPIGTVASRLARAKGVLRDRLTRRGVVLPAAGLAVVFAPSASAAPAPLLRVAFATAIGPTERVSPVVLSLTEGVLSAMRFAKLQTAAALVAVALGLTAALAAVSGHAGAVPATPAPGNTALVVVPANAVPLSTADDDKAAKEAEAKELKALQGKWRAVKYELDGKEVADAKTAAIQVAFEGNNLTITDEQKEVEEYKVALAPTEKPRRIDLTIKNPANGELDAGKVAPGIYELKDGMLTICIRYFASKNKERPTELKAGEGLTFFALERVKDEKDELAALAGEWKALRVNFAGEDIAAEDVAKGKWVIKDAEFVTVAEGAQERAELKLDPAAVPPTITLTITEGEQKGQVLRGIYFRQGDKLTIAFRGPGSKKDDRPTELKPGEEVAFMVFERKK